SNPTVGVEFQKESQVSPMSTTFSVDQAFPITRRLGIEKKLTTQLVTAADLEVRDVERRLIAEAQSLAVRLLALNQQRALRQQQTALARKLSDFVKGRAQAGELSALDAAQAQVDAQRLLLEARKLETESISVVGSLKLMLGLPPTDSLTISGDLPGLMPSGSASWSRRTDYQLAQTKIAAAQTEMELAKARKWQDVSAGLFAAREQQDMGGGQTEHTGFIGFRISIPLPLWNKNQGEIAEKTASADRARLEREALGKQILSEADTARREMQANADLAGETRNSLLPLVIEQTSKLEKAYESGQTDLLTVLRAREQRLQMEAAALDAVRDFHLARIRYEAAVGKHAPADSSAKNPSFP
ncbi:MAG: TolC family protein, partial [Prosthecobacter sp.]|nr:TolC family protein [Prosthecobacter sp.]